MNADVLSQLVPLFQTFSWILLVAIIVFSFRKQVKIFLDRFCSADEVEMSLGALTIQAKTMRELHRYIGLGFPDDKIDKEEIEKLIDLRIKGIQSEMERTIAQGDNRYDKRVRVNDEIRITCSDGNSFEGRTIDVSEAGIGFKSEGRLRFGEIVKVYPSDSEMKTTELPLEPFKIVRIEEAKGGYYYGATLNA
jgi:hypothetical protein